MLFHSSFEQTVMRVLLQDYSMPPLEELIDINEPPKCTYQVRGPNKETLNNVRVGDEIRHEWSCTSKYQRK